MLKSASPFCAILTVFSYRNLAQKMSFLGIGDFQLEYFKKELGKNIYRFSYLCYEYANL